MGTKHKALTLLALLLLLGVAGGACSSNVTHEPEASVAAVDEADQDEVLESDQDEFGRTDFSKSDSKAGGFLMSVAYVGMMVGTTVLPLLLL